MQFITYYKPKNEKIVHMYFISRLKEIVDWKEVKANEYMLSSDSRSFLHVDKFIGLTQDDRIPTAIRYESVSNGEEFTAPINSDTKWYYWDEELAIDVLSKTTNAANQNLFTASLKTGDFYLSEKLLKSGTDIHHRDKFNMTPLCYAVESLNLPLVKQLITMGADVTVIDDFKQNLLHHSLNLRAAPEFITKRIEMVRFLLDLGISVNHEDESGMTPFYFACILKETPPEIIELLIQNDATIDMEDNYGMTALMHALDKDFLTTIEVLVKHNANLNLQTSHGKHLTTLLNSIEACEIIEKRKDELTTEGLETFLNKRLELLFKNEVV